MGLEEYHIPTQNCFLYHRGRIILPSVDKGANQYNFAKKQEALKGATTPKGGGSENE